MTSSTPEGQILRHVVVGSPAHGGHAVARHDGRVVFVRHSAPGEVVDAVVTSGGPSSRFWRAEAVRIHEASADRVPHVWPQAGPGGVGGAELGHLTLPAQRRWKEQVLREALQRIGGLELEADVLAVPGETTGLGTRTRIDLTVDGEGRPGMHAHRSREVHALAEMPLAVGEIASHPLWRRSWPAGGRLQVIAPSDGDVLLLLDGESVKGDRRAVREVVEAGGRRYSYRVAGTGFWQVHRGAPGLLVGKVLEAAEPTAGQRVLELYSGAGLFTLPLADAVGGEGHVRAVEGDERAVRDARRNLHAHPQVDLVEAEVGAWLDGRSWAGEVPDLVVLDPPRSGVGAAGMAALLAAAPKRIVYVACDPAALARDLRVVRDAGWSIGSVTGYDLFPHTHHVEAIAVIDAP